MVSQVVEEVKKQFDSGSKQRQAYEKIVLATEAHSIELAELESRLDLPRREVPQPLPGEPLHRDPQSTGFYKAAIAPLRAPYFIKVKVDSATAPVDSHLAFHKALAKHPDPLQGPRSLIQAAVHQAQHSLVVYGLRHLAWVSTFILPHHLHHWP